MNCFTRSYTHRSRIASVRISALAVAAFLYAVTLTASQELRIAAAADLQFAMKDLAARYESQTKQHLEISYGSSGNFFTQIENGAPFDLFFSADSIYPQKLIALKLADPQSLYSYAFGRLALWAPADAHLQLAQRGFDALLDSNVHKIAIANPSHAPYGKAAVMALQKAGLYEKVKSKLVFGENVSQAAQFVQSGNAQIGIIALSLATSPAMQNGQDWVVPSELHQPLEQAAVVISSSKGQKTAAAFLEFVKSPEARKILALYGFTLSPSSSAGARP